MAKLNPSFRVSSSIFLFSITLLSIQFKASFGSVSTNEAYVTLLYGDEFLLGVRVLGKSIRDTGSHKDMVVLVSDGVSDYSNKLLMADGWKVEKISLLANPNQVHPKRFWGVYTKLKIFNMTDYKKVVYLDADTIVVKNIEDLFKCSKFCANLKHSERLNSGVMVVEPSAALFNDMVKQVKTLSSYTGGDQGFLNSYYPDFPNARVFDPSLSPEVIKSRPVPKMERLSTLYNADVGLYMLANKWMVDDSKLHIIHYTLGPLKPWDWWTAWLVKPVEAWHSIRVGLEETLPGTGGGKTPNDELIVKFLFLLPLCGLLFCLYRSIQGRDFLSSLCRSSVCNQIRHLYYKLRSNGTLGYSGVSTLSQGQPINSTGSNLPAGGCNDLEFWIDLPEDEEAKSNLKKGNLESSELYVHVKPALGGTFTDVVMWIFCPFNGPATLKIGLFTLPMTRIGEHVGDWEHFTFRVCNFSGELWQMFFSQHSGGGWVDASDIEFVNGNKPAVYSSKHGHASFPHPGMYLQGSSKLGIGVRNDVERSKYVVDSSQRYVVVAAEYLGKGAVAEPCWLQYMREWGPVIAYDSGSEINKIMDLLPLVVRFSIENIVDLFPIALYGEEGPTGPKEKDNWEGDELC